jgi:hypothetical protein
MVHRPPLRSFSEIPMPVPKSEPKSEARPKAEARPRSESVASPTIPPTSPLPAPLPESTRPPPVDEDDLEVAGAVPDSFSAEDAIDEQIKDLERWALANLSRLRSESWRFWILRGFAFVCAVASAAVPLLLGYTRAGLVLGACAALFIAIDAAWPGPSMRQNYHRGVCDLRKLQGTLKLRWDKVRLAYPNPASAKRVAHALALLDAVHAKREEIAKYLGNAEPSQGVRRKS